MNIDPRDRLNDLLYSGKNVLLHGPAGTGKTYTINEFIELNRKTNQDTLYITAPTGLAATHINGTTIHSAFSLKQFNLPDKLKSQITDYDYVESKLDTSNIATGNKMHEWITSIVTRSTFNERRLKYLVIDEISMASATLITIVDAILREKYDVNLPMGGVQCIFSGDFFQLPPVKDEYCNFTKAWEKAGIHCVEFVEPKRFTDGLGYFDFICRLRLARLNTDDKALIMSRLDAYIRGDHLKLNVAPIMLYPTNREIDITNNRKLDLIDSTEYVFKARDYIKLAPGMSAGKQIMVKSTAENMLCEMGVDNLRLKVGAQIIFTTNYNKDLKLVNGRMGKVIEIKRITTSGNKDDEIVAYHNPIQNYDNQDSHEHVHDNISVDLAKTEQYYVVIEDFDGVRHIINTYTKSINSKYFSCSRTQFPFKLAWAISIHKSQGMSIDAAIIDISKSFADGQSYVAISRVTNINGLFISKVDLNKIRANKAILSYFGY